MAVAASSHLREIPADLQIPMTALLQPLVRYGARRDTIDAVLPGFYDTVEEPNFGFEQKRRDEVVNAWAGVLEFLAECVLFTLWSSI